MSLHEDGQAAAVLVSTQSPSSSSLWMSRRAMRNGLLGSATSPQAVIEGLEVGVLLAGGRPSRLNQRRAEPGIPLAQASRSSFACALVAAWTQSGPGDQMLRRREALEIKTDLGEDGPGGRLLNAR